MAKLLDGKILAAKIKDELKAQVAQLKDKYNDVPHLVNLVIGEDAGSRTYANAQIKAAEYIGIRYELKTFPASISQKDFSNEIKKLNNDINVNGIMLHKPVPRQIDYHIVANMVDTNKDLEGINVANIGKMILGETRIIPCTPAAVMEHIKSTGLDIRGKEAVIVGHSGIVGKPLSLLLLESYATVTVCHIATSEAGKLQEHVNRADILVVAVGRPNLIKGDWVKKGAVVIDVGINRVGEKIVGDVEFEKAKGKAGFITPVPGGVGPVTVVMLMRNGIEAFKLQRKHEERISV
ncbi:MAG TPA: bifunctional 5,10-methylenetetrahydrofolate dehydrogenase/5,10-methenyltetrahydrofolate cyclohydrolase [Candidatus Omnitrophota bacterium]|nr:bifunctional 5,10-methylenetetrahydrofolate dehydrogenase/5,10-methenyltetrahydrofolate cyclohydrolase [Candidatus Omnitrophota bacterium]